MPKRAPKTDTSPTQGSLLDFLVQAQERARSEGPAPGSLNVQARLREAIAQAIKASPLSRWEIGARMSELIGSEVSKYSLDAWTSEAHDGHRFPAEYLPAFCQVVGSCEPLRVLGEVAGFFVVQGPEALRAEIQRIDEQIRRQQAEKRKRLIFLENIEKGNRQ